MKILFGRIGWGWKMFGLSGGNPGKTWFFGFSKEYQPIIDKKQNTLHNLDKKE